MLRLLPFQLRRHHDLLVHSDNSYVDASVWLARRQRSHPRVFGASGHDVQSRSPRNPGVSSATAHGGRTRARTKRRGDSRRTVRPTRECVPTGTYGTRPSGLAYFSRLGPDSRASRHRGPTNVRLRCHLGIDLPDSECGITVDGVSYSWKNGRRLGFDDSLPHEAWNDSIRERLVLIVDLWHPDRTDDEVRLLEGQLQRIAGETGKNADFLRRRQRVPGKARPALFGRLSAEHQ